MIIAYVMSVPKTNDYCTSRHMGRMYTFKGVGDSFSIFRDGRVVADDDEIKEVKKDIVSNLVKKRRGKFETGKFWYEIFSMYDGFSNLPLSS